MPELLKRSITGFILVGVMISAILFHPLSALAVFILITFAGLFEFYGLMNRLEFVKSQKLIHAIAGAYLLVVSYLGATGEFHKWLLLPYFIYFIYLYIAELYKEKGASIQNNALALFGHLYIAVPFAILMWFGFVHSDDYSPVLPMALFASIWINDSGAYLVGVKFGKHRLFERISPKKSWEGFCGGLFFALMGSLVFSHFSDVLNVWQWLGFAFTVSISATYGDLFESMLKRSLNIKDSGNILPGHGGILDRFDAPLLAIPAAAAYLLLFA
jgi:CDP-diglyceride synthetase